MIITPPLHDKSWQLLNYSGSLTALLREISAGKVQHHLQRREWSSPQDWEAALLDLPLQERVWIREIEWNYAGEVWVRGRVVIPQKTLREPQCQLLKEFGAEPLGELLFTDPNLSRSPFRIEALANGDWLRSSLFYFHQHPVLVTEIFTPALLNFKRDQ